MSRQQPETSSDRVRTRLTADIQLAARRFTALCVDMAHAEPRSAHLYSTLLQGRGVVGRMEHMDRIVKYPHSPLLHAFIGSGDTACVRTIIEAGGDVEERGHGELFYQTALQLAAWTGRTECVCVLLDGGADVSAADEDGNTPLHHVASNGVVTDIAKMLLERGADVNAVDGLERTPSHHAAAHRDMELVTLLVDGGANVNAKDRCLMTPLHFAAITHDQKGRADIVQMLVKRGADLNARDEEGNTPADHALFRQNQTALDALLELGGEQHTSVENAEQEDAPASGHQELEWDFSALLSLQGAQ